MTFPNAPVGKPPRVLHTLGLNEDEIRTVRRQGFVSQDVRGPNQVYYKLRFRMAGRQHVRYIGRDAALARLIALELRQSQQRIHQGRNLSRLLREAKLLLRTSKTRLDPQLAQQGFRFHGRAIRRLRVGRHLTHSSDRSRPCTE